MTNELSDERPTAIPVILDTDLGDDIDDTWALAMMLKSPELDIKLITTATGDTRARAFAIAKMLEIAGRTDIPIGIGTVGEGNPNRQMGWVGDFTLDRYASTMHDDGVGALIDTIMASPIPITLVSIGPLGNIADALQREPYIAERARFVGMQGSVKRGYDNKPEPDKEWNIVANIPAAQRVFTAPWPEMIITPLDTCGTICLRNEKYQAVRDSDDPLMHAVMENYRAWAAAGGWGNPDEASTILFDTVAVYLAFTQDLLEVVPLGIRVTDDGLTAIDETARTVHCALEWKDLAAFEDFLVARLVG